MTLVELRVLDGANLYFPRPAVKLTLDVAALVGMEPAAFATAVRAAGLPGVRTPGPPASQQRLLVTARVVARLLRRLARASGVASLAVRSRSGPGDDHLVVAYPWRRRGAAEALGEALAGLVDDLGAGRPVDVAAAGNVVKAAEPGEPPSVPRPRIPVVAVTGTNGKTSVTRLIAHMAATAGHVVGLTSTDGIDVAGTRIEDGDWSGYGGAGRVLSEPEVTFAVLETARGGMLLRGIGAAHNDVAVVTNVTRDHLGMHGVDTLDQLAEVKSALVTVTRAGGWVVLNAEDPRVLPMRLRSKGRAIAFALDPAAPGLRQVLDEGGWAATVLDGELAVLRGGTDVDRLVPVLDVPVTLAGISRPHTANALAAASAGLAAGLPRDAVVAGLRTFGASANPMRMNLFGRGDQVVVLDSAHNEDSLAALLEVLRGLALPGSLVWLAMGMAGDRPDDVLRAVGELGARGADRVVAAEKEKYRRGRQLGEIAQLMAEGAASVGVTDVPTYSSELLGLQAIIAAASPADVLGLMCHAEFDAVTQWLAAEGFTPLGAGAVRGRAAAASTASA